MHEIENLVLFFSSFSFSFALSFFSSSSDWGWDIDVTHESDVDKNLFYKVTEVWKLLKAKNKTQFVHFFVSFVVWPSSVLLSFVFLSFTVFPPSFFLHFLPSPFFLFFSPAPGVIIPSYYFCPEPSLVMSLSAASCRHTLTYTHACNHMYACTCTGMEVIKAEVKGRPHYPEPVKTLGVFYALVSIKEA